MKETNDLLAEISAKLTRILAVLAVQGKNDEDKIRILYGVGLDSSEIAQITGISPGAVRMKKARLKSRKNSRKR